MTQALARSGGYSIPAPAPDLVHNLQQAIHVNVPTVGDTAKSRACVVGARIASLVVHITWCQSQQAV